MFVPYTAMMAGAWPTSGDLGMSLCFAYTSPGGKTTRIQWSEDGHPWNTRWYGLVRLLKTPDEELPYVIRVK